MELETSLSQESPVHYFTMHEETWRESSQWPPAQMTQRLFLGETGTLSVSPGAKGDDRLAADFGFGTGAHTRYGRLAAHDIRTYYDDWQSRESRLPCYRSKPLDTAFELIGHAVLSLHLAASEPDAALHVYLSEEEPDGTVRYVTEGVLRALHRKLSPCPPNYSASWPYHTCNCGDAAPLVPGRPEEIVVVLLPTAWNFAKGSRIRLAIAGADVDNYGQVPHGRPPFFTIDRGNSFLDLPCAATKAEVDSGRR